MISSRRNSLSLPHSECWLDALLTTIALSTVLLLGLILVFLGWESWPALAGSGWRRFLGGGWFPGSNEYNLWQMFVASVCVTLGAIVLAAPLGIMGAVFAHHMAPPWMARPWRALISVLAGIPSVVFGLWGLTTLVPLLASWAPPGPSLLAAILILTLMILPTIMLRADAAIALVSRSHQQGAAALGLSATATIVQVILPAARSGIAGGVVLATVRAAGETMAVLMVAGNIVQVPHSLFDPVRVLTANMALEMAYATGDHRASLFVAGSLLTLLVALLVRMATPESTHHHG